MELNKVIGENIQNLRKAKNMTQKDLAKIFNYTPKAISKWERGEAIPEVATLKTIADFFGVTVDCLLNEKGFTQKEKYRTNKNIESMKVVASCLLISIIVTVCAIVFVYKVQNPNIKHPWVVWLWSIPLSALPPLYFYRKDNRPVLIFILYSVLLWGILVAVYFQLFEFDFRLIFLIGIPAEVSILFLTRVIKLRR